MDKMDPLQCMVVMEMTAIPFLWGGSDYRHVLNA